MQDQSSISAAEARGFVPVGRCPEAESGINQMTNFRNYEGRMTAAPPCKIMQPSLVWWVKLVFDAL